MAIAVDLDGTLAPPRARGDRRTDVVVKPEIAGRYRIDLVLDARDQVVGMGRDRLGLTCFQVTWGKFSVNGRSPRSSAVKAALYLALFAVVHSALASLSAKRLARERVGERVSSGLYRFAFNAFAVLSLGVLLRFIWQLPDRSLYRVRGVFGLLMRAGQLASLLTVIAASRQVGFGRITGITAFRQYLQGRPILPTPPVQHPDPEGPGDDPGWHGPFSVSSHPNNYFAMLVIVLSPDMTVKWASIALGTVVYMFAGSSHEDRRLLAAYGQRYVRYRERVPQFAIPVRHLIDSLLPSLARFGSSTGAGSRTG